MILFSSLLKCLRITPLRRSSRVEWRSIGAAAQLLVPLVIKRVKAPNINVHLSILRLSYRLNYFSTSMSEHSYVFEAWIECDGERLPEFPWLTPTPMDSRFTTEVNSSTCAVASKANKVLVGKRTRSCSAVIFSLSLSQTFSIKWKYAGNRNSLAPPIQTQAHLYIDGIYITSRVSDNSGGITTIDSAAVGEYQRRRLKFQEILQPGLQTPLTFSFEKYLSSRDTYRPM